MSSPSARPEGLLSRWRDSLPGDRQLVLTGLLIVLFVVIAARDITRPYYGLHGYAQAYAAWFARAHVNYGLGYTHGLNTLAVGNPPPAKPARYLDHPPQQALLDAAALGVFGQNEWALRVAALIAYVLTLPLLVQLLRRLYDEVTAVLAVFLFIMFPITGYFYSTAGEAHYTNFSLGVLAWWSYLALIGGLKGVVGRSRHLWMLGIALFLIVQSDWIGACYAAPIGTHYVARCLWRRQLPNLRLFLVLFLAPAAGLAIDFAILLGASGWDIQRMIGLYRFRSAVAASPERTLSGWVAQQGEFVVANFTWPALVMGLVCVGYLAATRLGVVREVTQARRVRYAWLFLGPGALYMLLFTEAYWVHQHMYMPFAIGVAIVAALGILQVRDVLMVRSKAVGDMAALATLVVIVVLCTIGLHRYYASRHHPPEVLAMFERLNREIPPDRALLAFFNQVYIESPFKAPFYRPEIAWYLDREIVTARTLEEIEKLAAGGRFSFYHLNVPFAPVHLVEALKKRYPFEFLKSSDYHAWPPVIAYHPETYLFDLRRPLPGAHGEQSAQEAAPSPGAEPLETRGLMKLGLSALYEERNPQKAVGFFRQLLKRNPEHYGGTFQLAVALDQANDPAAARPYWEIALRMAETYRDETTIARIRQRLARQP